MLLTLNKQIVCRTIFRKLKTINDYQVEHKWERNHIRYFIYHKICMFGNATLFQVVLLIFCTYYLCYWRGYLGLGGMRAPSWPTWSVIVGFLNGQALIFALVWSRVKSNNKKKQQPKMTIISVSLFETSSICQRM